MWNAKEARNCEVENKLLISSHKKISSQRIFLREKNFREVKIILLKKEGIRNMLRGVKISSKNLRGLKIFGEKLRVWKFFAR